MENFNLAQFLTLLGVIVGGLFAAFSLMDKGIKDRGKVKDDLDDKIRKLLQEENKELSDKVDSLSDKVADLTDKQNKAETENNLLKEVFQGRDKDAMAYRSEGREAMKLVKEITQVSINNGKKTDAILDGMAKQNKNIERLAKALEKHIANLDGR